MPVEGERVATHAVSSPSLPARWYRNATIYSLDLSLFQDSNGDGIGDLQGLRRRLGYLSRLGITAVWLGPIHPSPRRDAGYDVVDYYGVDPRFGTLGDLAELLNDAEGYGIRILLDLVVNHTSDEHPWFRAACEDRDSPYRDWYVWSDEEPTGRWRGAVFPGAEERTETWTWCEGAGAWYYHRFYSWQPDLNTRNPLVRAEIRKICDFWLRMGIAGFRFDAAPFVVEGKHPGVTEPDYQVLHEIRESVSWRASDAVLIAEANVADSEVLEYFGNGEGSASRMTMVFAFRLNQAVMLALARCSADPVRKTLHELPDLPKHGQWATFLRNHDEVDLGRLTDEERADVFAAFGPEPNMQLYGRGIRRRLAPMLGNDRRRIEMAVALHLSLPGTPVIRYGDEIGMGENLELSERQSIRTPMQWDGTDNAGFSTADAAELVAPVITEGDYGYRALNVIEQRRKAGSLLGWYESLLHTRRECPELGTGHHTVIEGTPSCVLADYVTGATGRLLCVHNFADAPQVVSIRLPEDAPPQPDVGPLTVASDAEYGEDIDLTRLELNPYGYRWLRIDESG
jgi:maltose alpha-D-glucosyltransferase / alpha-amylase